MNNNPHWPNDLNDPHSQPTVAGQYPQPPTKQTFKQRFSAMSKWKKFGTIGCGTIIGTILLCSLCAIVANALPKAPRQPTTVAVQQSPTVHQIAHVMPTTTTPPSPTPSPTDTPTPEPTQQPQQPAPPVQQPAPPLPTTGVYGNPWGYNFTPGNYIYSPVSDFCTAGYFSCIANFPNGKGYVEECNDGMYSKSGGRSGSCSDHKGDKQPLYSH
jgi:hypothetical protein